MEEPLGSVKYFSLSERSESKRGGKYTAKHGIKRLAYIEEHDNYEQAKQREKQIKGWTRNQKEFLINGIWKKDW